MRTSDTSPTHACEICGKPQWATHGSHSALCLLFLDLRDRVTRLEAAIAQGETERSPSFVLSGPGLPQKLAGSTGDCPECGAPNGIPCAGKRTGEFHAKRTP